MQGARSGFLFNVRFSLRTLLFTVTGVSLFLALCPLLFAKEFGFYVFWSTFALFCLGLSGCAIWMVVRNSPTSLGILIVFHLAIASFVFLGPITSYHVNGRAWYDYGMSGWDPPPFHYRDGSIGIGDYDPKFTRPAVWPVVGPVMLVMCVLSANLLILPPTGPIVAICLFISAVRQRRKLTMRQSLFVWASWTIGLIPLLYMAVWGGKVIEWVAD